MKFGVGVEIDRKARNKSHLIHELADELGSFISSNDYGSSIEHFTIGIVCILTTPGYEDWHKARKPRFLREQKIKMLSGETVLFKNAYSYDIKIDNEDYKLFLAANEKDSKRMLAKEILESFSCLDRLPKHVKDFDREYFISSVKGFLKERGLL